MGRRSPFLYILDTIPERSGDIIANLKTLQKAYSAARISAPASHKTGITREERHLFTAVEMITALVLDPEQSPL